MNLKKYSSYFHDGGLINVEQNKDNIKILMESNQLLPEWNEDNIPLSNFQTVKGILHLEGVKNIIVSHVSVNTIKMNFDSGEILDFDVLSDKKIRLLINWINFHPKPRTNDCNLIEIEAEKIYWENIPDLEDE